MIWCYNEVGLRETMGKNFFGVSGPEPEAIFPVVGKLLPFPRYFGCFFNNANFVSNFSYNRGNR